MNNLTVLIFFSRKQEKLDSKEIVNEDILPGNTEETETDTEFMCGTSFTDTLSESSPQLSQKRNQEYKNIKSNCKVDIIQPKLLNNSQKLSPVDSGLTTTSQLASEQYINIFNRYQVF